MLQTSFPAEGLPRPDNFVSLLYYLGLLSFAGEREGRPLLKIPNRTVRQLMYGYPRGAYDEVGVFRPSTDEIADGLNQMAYRGEWQGFFDYLVGEAQRHPILLLYSGWELVHRKAVATSREPSGIPEDGQPSCW